MIDIVANILFVPAASVFNVRAQYCRSLLLIYELIDNTVGAIKSLNRKFKNVKLYIRIV